MLERRRFPRINLFKGAKVYLVGRPPLSCTVRDLSNHGAGLQFRSTADLPAEFDLSFDTGRTVRQCRVAWQTRTAVGVSFQQITEVMHQCRSFFHESRLFAIALKFVFTVVFVANLLHWLAYIATARILGYMATGWIIIAHREQHDTGAPLKEWYAVAIPDRVRAVEALRLRKNLLDATLMVESEASPEYLDQLDVKDGQILSIVPL